MEQKKMKFDKAYQNHMKEQTKKLPEIGYGRLKHTLKQCRTHIQPQPENKPQLSECDGTLLKSLLDEMQVVVECFNKQAKKLLNPTLMAGVWKYFNLSCSNRKKLGKDDGVLVRKGEYLLMYAMFNAIAFRKLLKKYDKNCEKGQAFNTSVQAKHMEILRSPWFFELMAFHMNLRDRKLESGKTTEFFEGLSLAFTNVEKPSMTIELLGSISVDVDLTCSICLDTVFDAVALKCGHIMCYTCATSAASVTIVDGLKEAAPHKKCPLCRQAGVYGGATPLKELNILLSRRCPEYWGERLRSERVERLRLVKDHWQSQCRALMGV